MEQSYWGMVFSMLYYTSLFTLVIFLILLFIHFTITPIFALTADNAGIIVISGAGDRELSYTNELYTAESSNKRTPPNKTTRLPQCSYTIGFDIKKVDQTRPTGRIAVLYRATGVKSGPITYTNFNQTNILVSTTEEAADLITVELVSSKGVVVGMKKSISLTNSWQRISIVLADTFAEVYLNGTQVSTIVIDDLKQVGSTTDFFPPNDSSVEISHMSMWPRILSPKEIRYYESKPMNPKP